ncbi:MAG: hypothetical protein ABIF85_07850 [Nanoarchaeota archaeon]|nr:hypothetical protein [Nanoarchaeota archaeon]MBU4300447.1 hypothetical protein [Nanoarchaeota archaeon]MBU4451662.1 hypothetical protein [Nanoarchaeota archaeon]MCG2723396.1 hypothetical protein [archaeon]
MYLAKLLGSTTKINILSVLITNPGRSYFEKELAGESGCSLSEINRQIGDLVKSNLVRFQKMAKVKIYRINENHFLFKPLFGIFRDLNLIYEEIAGNLVKFSTKRFGIACVILIGSLSKKAVRSDIVEAPSDIDLIFVVKKDSDIKNFKEALIGHINSEIIETYGISIYPIVVSEDYYKKGLVNNSLIIEAQAKGKILCGSKPRRIG